MRLLVLILILFNQSIFAQESEPLPKASKQGFVLQNSEYFSEQICPKQKKSLFIAKIFGINIKTINLHIELQKLLENYYIKIKVIES